jgi:hypothetical protein
MPKPREFSSGKRFQKKLKIINASGGEIRFDGVVKGNRNRKQTVPACLGGGFKALMRSRNSLGAGL